MGEIMSYQNYEQYKKELDGELQKTAEGFVRIGYLLKVARDTNILAESGYKSVAEFAQAEYNLDKTQVSRFISINDKFSEGGNSDRLLPEFQGYGYAKLTIMLQIPAEIAEELSPNLSKADIQAIKEEIDEERKISDIEVALEAKRWDLEDMTLLEKVMYLLMDENGEEKLYRKIWDAYRRWGIDEQTIRPIMAPSGEKVFSVRIPAAGRVMMVMDDTKDEISITNTRSGEKEVFSWQDVAETAAMMADSGKETVEECWEEIYGKDWPWKEEVAPVQQKEPASRTEKKPEPKKENKVSKAKVEKKPQKPEPEPEKEEEEQLEGQMSVEDYPELMPDGEENNGTSTGMDAGDVQPGEPDRSGDETADGGSEADKGTEGDEIQGTDEGDGAAEGGGCEPDSVVGRNKEFFELKRRVEEDVQNLANIVNVFGWLYNEEDFQRAYKKTVNVAANMERLAQRLGWKLYEE